MRVSSRFRTGEALPWLMALFAAVSLMSACSTGGNHAVSTLTAEEVVGVWCGSAGDVLEIESDGDFTLDQLSWKLLEIILRDRDVAQQNSDTPTAGVGTWAVAELSKTHRLRLSFDKVGGLDADFGHELLAASIDGSLAFLSYASDPDLGYDHKFSRCSGQAS